MPSSDYVISTETQQTVAAFNDADETFKKAVADFEERHQAELEILEQLRNTRNVRLSEAKEALRDEATKVPYYQVTRLSVGILSATKKWSSYYDPEAFKAIAMDHGLYTKLIEDGIITEHIEIGAKFDKKKFEATKAWLQDKGWAELFTPAEDGRELTPAVAGADPIAGFMSSKS